MTIITFQDQEVQEEEVLSMPNHLLVNDLFENILAEILTAKPYRKLLNRLKFNLEYKSFQTKYSRAKDVIEDAASTKTISTYKEAMSHLKKLGMITTYKGRILLNPLVKTRFSSALYVPVIEYYNIMWSEEFRRSIHISYKDFRFTLGTLDELKELIVQYHSQALVNDKELGHLTIAQIRDIAFTYTKTNLASPETLDYLQVENPYSLLILKAKMSKTYTNLGYKCMDTIAAYHFDILQEQLPIVFLPCNNIRNERNYSFCKLPLKWKCISFKETKFYKEAIAFQQLPSECY